MTITKDNSSFFKIKDCLPIQVSSALTRLDKSTLDKICEIRLRDGGITTITIEGENHVLSIKGLTKDVQLAVKCSRCDIEDFIYKFCRGSVYAHENTISENFLIRDGIRVGLGKGSYSESDIHYGITSINIRIPRHIHGFSDHLMNHITDNGFYHGSGILIISNPGVGKTTLLRDLAINLSSGKKTIMKRVCVIDERNEIFMEKIFENCCIDFISGVEKCRGIETASRLLSPEIIICDEISGPTQANEITLQKNSGIVFIASYHADSAESALRKEYIRKMFEEGVFSHLYLLTRNKSKITGLLTKYDNV